MWLWFYIKHRSRQWLKQFSEGKTFNVFHMLLMINQWWIVKAAGYWFKKLLKICFPYLHWDIKCEEKSEQSAHCNSRLMKRVVKHYKMAEAAGVFHTKDKELKTMITVQHCSISSASRKQVFHNCQSQQCENRSLVHTTLNFDRTAPVVEAKSTTCKTFQGTGIIMSL